MELATIPLTQGKIALIDIDDLERVSRHKWFAAKVHRGDYFYAGTKFPGSTNIVFLHRFLTDPPPGMVVDHINGNTLDNRRENLRVCNQQVNIWNSRRRREGKNHSKYRGVYRSKEGVWEARITLGTFDNEEDAARAHDRAVRLLRGKDFPTNFND